MHRVWSLRLKNPLFVLGPLLSAKGETASWLQGDYPKMQMALGALQGFYMVSQITAIAILSYCNNKGYLTIYFVIAHDPEGIRNFSAKTEI